MSSEDYELNVSQLLPRYFIKLRVRGRGGGEGGGQHKGGRTHAGDSRGRGKGYYQIHCLNREIVKEQIQYIFKETTAPGS